MILSLNLSSKTCLIKDIYVNGKDQLSVVPPVMIKFEFNSLTKFFWFFSDPTDQKMSFLGF